MYYNFSQRFSLGDKTLRIKSHIVLLLRISHRPGWPETLCVAEDDFQFQTHVPSPSESWNFRNEPPQSIYVALGTKSGLHYCWVDTPWAERYLWTK